MSSFNDNTVHDLYLRLKNYSKNTCRNFAILKVAFANENVALLYEKAIEKHNKSVLNNYYCDSGFDLFVPEDAVFEKEVESKFVDMKVKTEMVYCNVANDNLSPAAFHMYTRSSISKTPLMLANHVGIIDSGYRGSIIGAFRWFHNPTSKAQTYVVEMNTRLLQICHPTLCPIYIMVVQENELSTTERGAGGFGSTGV